MSDTRFRRLKYVAAINPDKLAENTSPEHRFRYVDIACVGRGELVEAPLPMTFGTAPSRARRLVRYGDTIVSTVRTYLRAVLPVPRDCEDLVVSTGFAVLRPGPEFDSRFFSWAVQADPFIEEMVARSVGVNYPTINAADIGDIVMALPTLRVQRATARYLDRESSQIDSFAATQQRLVHLLNEEIDARVRLHIGRSSLVDPHSSGTSTPIRRILEKLSRPPLPEAEMVTAFRDGQVTARSLRRTDGFTESASEDAAVQGVETEDVVVHGLDGFAGAIGVAERGGVCSPVYHVCQAVHGADPAYIARMLRILALEGYLELFTTSTRERAVDLRNWDLFREIPVPVVSLDEQRRVGDKIRRMRSLELAVTRSVALAKERRQALITAAVTGELDVLEAA